MGQLYTHNLLAKHKNKQFRIRDECQMKETREYNRRTLYKIYQIHHPGILSKYNLLHGKLAINVIPSSDCQLIIHEHCLIMADPPQIFT